MTAHTEAGAIEGSPRVAALRRQLRLLRRRGLTRQARLLAGLVVLTLVTVVLVTTSPPILPIGSLALPLLLGSLLLSPRVLPWFVVYVLALLVLAVFRMDERPTWLVVAAIGVVFAQGLVVLLMSFRRSRLGVAGFQGESMFVDLRDRILRQGGIPRLPQGWHAESALSSAGGTLFAGDFVVASRPSPERLDLVVVDVSGKGEQAGTRALLLSGAFGGLLGALPCDRFLSAANDYLLRQDWAEGFATAIHLTVNLVSGEYEVRTAGHPPALHRSAGSGRWSVLESSGPILGLMPEADYEVARGTLLRGDAIMLYTDGMVEEPRRDIELGIDRLLGEAEALLRGDFTGAAKKLVDALGSADDDRALVVVNRR